MSWKQLLAARKVHTHQTSKQELDWWDFLT